MKYFGHILTFINHTVNWKRYGYNQVHKHDFKFSRVAVNDLSLDETKQCIKKGGNADRYRYL